MIIIIIIIIIIAAIKKTKNSEVSCIDIKIAFIQVVF